MGPVVTLGELAACYGKRWRISAGVAGGFYAVRHHDISPQAMELGLSTVRAGATLDELARHLAVETDLENRWIPGL